MPAWEKDLDQPKGNAWEADLDVAQEKPSYISDMATGVKTTGKKILGALDKAALALDEKFPINDAVSKYLGTATNAEVLANKEARYKDIQQNGPKTLPGQIAAGASYVPAYLLPGGALLGSLAAGGSEGSARQEELLAKGVDEETANKAGAFEGVTQAIANLLPGGRGLLKGAAIGAGTNATQQVVSDVAAERMLQDKYSDVAAQYAPSLEKTAVAAATGGAFGAGVNIPGAIKSSRANTAPIPDEPTISGLLGYRDPDPLISFPDGSVARKSDLDSVDLPPNSTITRRSELLGRNVEAPPTADQIVQRETIPATKTTADVIAEQTNLGRDAPAKEADIAAAFDEPIDIGGEKTTMGDIYRQIADERSPLSVDEVMAAKTRYPTKSIQEIIAESTGVSRKLVGTKDAKAAFGAEDSRIAQAGKGQVERGVTVAEVLNRGDVQKSPLSTERVQAPGVNDVPKPSANEPEVGASKLGIEKPELGTAKDGKGAGETPTNGDVVFWKEGKNWRSGTLKSSENGTSVVRDFQGKESSIADDAVKSAEQVPKRVGGLARDEVSNKHMKPTATQRVVTTGDASGDIAGQPKMTREDIADFFFKPEEIGGEKTSHGDIYLKINNNRSTMSVGEVIEAKKANPEKTIDQIINESLGKIEAEPNPDIIELNSGFNISKQVKAALGLDKATMQQYGDWANAIGATVKNVVSKPMTYVKKADSAGQNPLASIARDVWHSAYTNMDIAIKKAGDSPSARQVLKHFGTALGKGEGTAKTFQEAEGMHIGGRANELAPTLDKVNKVIDRLWSSSGRKAFGKAKHTEDVWQQVIKMVESPKARQGDLGKAAEEIVKFLDEELKYQKEAGVDIGESKNYFPTKYNPDKILSNQAAFLKDAETAYLKEGLSADEAAVSAKGLLDLHLYGMETPIAGKSPYPSTSSSKKARVFTKPEALDALRKYRVSDGSEVLYHYISQSAKRAEIARRFGDNFSAWESLEKHIRKEGGQPIVDQLKDFVLTATNSKARDIGKGAQAASLIRTGMTLGALEKAVIPNLMEAITPLATTNGNFRSAVATIRSSLDGLTSWLAQSPPGQRRQHAEDLGKYLGLISDVLAGEQAVARYSGFSAVREMESKALHQFFMRNRMQAVEEGNRKTALDVGTIWFDSLAKSIEGNGFMGDSFTKTAKKSLRDFGVPAGKEVEFAKFVSSMKNQIPTPDQLKKAGPMGDMYATAIQRFTNATVMKADSTTRPGWASSPWGSLIYQLGSYTGTFHDRFLRRGMHQAVDVIKNKDDYSLPERAALMTGMLPGMMVMGAASYLAMEAKDEVFNKLSGNKKDMTNVAKVERAVANANFMGKYGRIFEQLGQQRWGGGSVANVLIPPGMAQLAKGLDATWKAIQEGDGKNAGERALAKWMFNVIGEPLFQIALGAGPGLPANAIGAGLTILGPSAAEGPVVDALAGKKQTQSKPIKGVTETLFGNDGNGRSTGRSDARKSGR